MLSMVGLARSSNDSGIGFDSARLIPLPTQYCETSRNKVIPQLEVFHLMQSAASRCGS